MTPSRVIDLVGANAVAVGALLCTACDGIIGLDPTILVPDAASPPALHDAESDASSDAADSGTEALACGPGATMCASGCADTASDGRNCGACDHDCLGGTCSGGRCLPQVLATGGPAQIAVDGTSVYWIDTTYGTVLSCSADTCQSVIETVFAGPGGAGNGPLYAGGLAVQGGRVFFSESDLGGGLSSEVYACSSTGCGASPDLVFSGGSAVVNGFGPSFVGSVVADADNVYWTYVQTVYECPLGGCANVSPSPALLASGTVDANGPGRLAVRDGSIYFAETGSGVGTCSVVSGNCMPADPLNLLEVTALAAGPSGVYWTSAGANQVLAIPPGSPDADATSGALFATVASPGALAVDSENVYFTTTQEGGAIYRCAVGGCNQTPSVVAINLGPLGAVAVDGQRIYAVVGIGTQTNPPPGPFGLSTTTGTAIVWIAK